MAESDAADHNGIQQLAYIARVTGDFENAWRHFGQAIVKREKDWQKGHQPPGAILSQDRPHLAAVWWRYRRMTAPDELPTDVVRYVVRLAEPKLAPGLTSAAVRVEIEALEKASLSLSDFERAQWLRAAAETGSLHQLDDLALQLWHGIDCFRPTGRTALLIGEQYARRRDWRCAVQWYEQVLTRPANAPHEPGDGWHHWASNENEPLCNLPEPELKVLALMLKAQALTNACETAAAERLDRLAVMSLLADTDLSLRLGYELQRRHQTKLAERVFSRVSQSAVSEFELAMNYERRADQIADDDPARAEKMWRFWRLLAIDDDWLLWSDEASGPYEAYQLTSQRIAQLQALALLKSGDFAQALIAGLKAEAVHPVHLDLTQELVVRFQKHGAEKEASVLFQQMWSRRLKILDDFPNAADVHAQLGRLGVACHRELTASLTHAERAVALRPTHVPYILNVARLHLALGELDKARSRVAEARKLDAVHDELPEIERQLRTRS